MERLQFLGSIILIKTISFELLLIIAITFRSDKSSMKIALKLGNGEDGKSVDRIAINKVTAIPLGRWSLDHITPREYCVVKNGTCVVSGYELPPGGIRVSMHV